MEQFGLIFDIRWPSKRFKSSRRFVYVQYVHPVSFPGLFMSGSNHCCCPIASEPRPLHLTQSAAEAALSLDGTEVGGPGLQLQVKVSNPSRKNVRTDANLAKKEIHVSGLQPYAKEADLQKLFDKASGCYLQHKSWHRLIISCTFQSLSLARSRASVSLSTIVASAEDLPSLISIQR